MVEMLGLALDKVKMAELSFRLMWWPFPHDVPLYMFCVCVCVCFGEPL
jgi:hypothetical protein